MGKGTNILQSMKMLSELRDNCQPWCQLLRGGGRWSGGSAGFRTGHQQGKGEELKKGLLVMLVDDSPSSIGYKKIQFDEAYRT